MTTVLENLSTIKEQIAQSCSKVKRDPKEIQIVAVTKTQPESLIREAAACGLNIFGESRIQEAKTKLPALKMLGQWHLIGHLQTNKIKTALELFDLVESVDSLNLGQELSKQAQKTGQEILIYAEINVSGEEQKHGFQINSAYDDVSHLAQLPGLKLKGLMTMAPLSGDVEQARPVFKGLKELGKRLEMDLGPLALSMGMSQDYSIAVEEGATHLRIGSALFK
jgi:pyridoxal phosphate enzyme (YggS family)